MCTLIVLYCCIVLAHIDAPNVYINAFHSEMLFNAQIRSMLGTCFFAHAESVQRSVTRFRVMFALYKTLQIKYINKAGSDMLEERHSYS